MKVSINRFVVASKYNPMEFWVEDYGSGEDIMQAILYENENDAIHDVEESDEPDLWRTMPVEVIYRF